jgi:hypothetical protein
MDHSKEFHSTIVNVNAFQSIFSYLSAGFLFGSLCISFSFFSQVTAMISSLCFYLGLRIIKKERKSISCAFYISIFLIIFSGIDMVLFVTPFHIPKLINDFVWGLKIIEVILICLGLSQVMKNKMYPILLGACYSCMIFLNLFITWYSLLEMIALGMLFLLLFYLLINFKHNLFKQYSQVHLSPVKMSVTKVTLFYLIGVITLTFLVNGIYPYFMYQTRSMQQPHYSYPVLDEQSFPNGKVTIYDYDEDYYLNVYHYQIQKQQLKAIKISIQHLFSRHYQPSLQVVDLSVNDGCNDYVIQKNENPSSHMNEYLVYLHPQKQNYTIQFGILVNKKIGDQESGLFEECLYIDYSQYKLTFEAYKDVYRPYQQLYVRGSSGKIEKIFE